MAYSHQPNTLKRTIDVIELSSSSSSSSSSPSPLDNGNKHDLAVTTTHSSITITKTINQSPIGLATPSYQPFTMNGFNQERLTILPAYPPSDQIHIPDAHNDNSNDMDLCFDSTPPIVLLLTNVPVEQLSKEEIARRRPDKIQCSIPLDNPSTGQTSHLTEFYQNFFGSAMMERLNIGFSVLDYSYSKLKEVIQLCEIVHNRILQEYRLTYNHFTLNDTEFKQLLEIYLQIDVDLFYMKTCSFGQAQPRLKTEGIFCLEIPECRYAMTYCNKTTCQLCSLSSPSTRRHQYAVDFNNYQKHRFVNGYESILNCPATCHTQNIIFVLTCYCGEYDYIAETSDSLWKYLSKHHTIIHRLIIEQLIGKHNYMECFSKPTLEMTKKDSSRIFQHLKRCSNAIQSFLDVNDSYWIFVPLSNESANEANQHYQRKITSSSTYNTKIQGMLKNVPVPPQGFQFTYQQLDQQYEFFEYKLYKNFNDIRYNVYTTTIILVLPSNASQTLRHILHSLFVTHTESKLNTLGHLFRYTSRIPVNQHVWCERLCHPAS